MNKFKNRKIMSYLDFCNELQGFSFWRGTRQIYRFEMYWSGLTPSQCFEKFDSRIIIKEPVSYN